MRNIKHLISKHRVAEATAAGMDRSSSPGTPEDLAAAALDALNDMGNIVSPQYVIHPETLTQDRIEAYALALMRLRECACAAGFERLRNACDALAVTVSQLIEDRNSACREKCEALMRFVGHAQAMIRMSVDGAKRYALSIPDIRPASDSAGVKRTARVSM
jgi:hypothetical protein